jgi:hypothetical protein
MRKKNPLPEGQIMPEDREWEEAEASSEKTADE